MILRSRIVGSGAYLPANKVSNAELAKTVDTSDEWITERTGICFRHLAAEGELTSDLATKASQAALKSAGLTPADIDLIVLGTTTPDQTFPATATKVQANLGMTHGAAFDVQAVCSGFIYSLAIADNALRLGQAKRALVIGAETFSRLLDWNDRQTCVLFGDGAGAVVLEAGPGEGKVSDRGVLSTHLHSDGRYQDILLTDGGPSSTGTVGKVQMQGKDVFRHAVDKLAKLVEEALTANGLTGADIDWLIPHQANKRIMDGVAKKLGLGTDHVVATIDRHANTSAASIPLALAEAHADGRIQPGQLLLLEAIGGGLAWGAAVIRW